MTETDQTHAQNNFDAAFIEKLQTAGLRKTRPRLAIGRILFSGDKRHVTAEKLAEEVAAAGELVSLATIYNTLNQFCACGLLREVIVDSARSYFDTNLEPHQHFYIEDEQHLIDIDMGESKIDTPLPKIPNGYEIDDVDVVIRLRTK